MAAAVGERFGMTGEEIARGVHRFAPTKMRMNILQPPGRHHHPQRHLQRQPPVHAGRRSGPLGDAKDRRKVAIARRHAGAWPPSSDLFHAGGWAEYLGEMGIGLPHRRGRAGHVYLADAARETAQWCTRSTGLTPWRQAHAHHPGTASAGDHNSGESVPDDEV